VIFPYTYFLTIGFESDFKSSMTN